MPGFMVGGGPEGLMGGMVNRQSPSSRLSYYYNYFWEIENMFESKSNNRLTVITAKDLSLPLFTVIKETYTASSLEYKFAKSVSWDDVKVSWYDSAGLLEIVRSWRRSVWTHDKGLQTAENYKKKSIVSNFLPTNKKANSWTLINSWPSQIRSSELTYTSSEAKLIEVTVTYDWAEETVVGDSIISKAMLGLS